MEAGLAEPTDSCTILTTDANEVVGSIHDLMPVILDPGDYDLWLDPDVQDANRLEPLLVQYTGAEMRPGQSVCPGHRCWSSRQTFP
jgi:putative SOS response-associated peptidase YedK